MEHPCPYQYTSTSLPASRQKGPLLKKNKRPIHILRPTPKHREKHLGWTWHVLCAYPSLPYWLHAGPCVFSLQGQAPVLSSHTGPIDPPTSHRHSAERKHMFTFCRPSGSSNSTHQSLVLKGSGRGLELFLFHCIHFHVGFRLCLDLFPLPPGPELL